MNNKIIDLQKYFINNFHYKTIKMEFHDDSSWIYNENYKYNLIRISDETIPNSAKTQALINNIINIVKEKINCEIVFLDIHITNDLVSNNLFYDTITINTNHYDGVNIMSDYPDIKNVFNIEKVETIVPNKKIVEINHNKQNILQKNESKPLATNIVMFICIVLYGLYTILNVFDIGLLTNESINALLLGAYYKESIVVCHEYYRFITAGLLHLDFFHLLVNMIALKSLGTIVEKRFGRYNFLLILLISIIGGNLFVFMMNNNILVIGISGGLYGLMASILVLLFESGLYRVPQIRMNIISILLMNLLISLMPGISLAGHLGGFIFGLLLSIFLFTKKKFKLIRVNSIISIIILSIFITFNIYTTKEVDNPNPNVLVAYTSVLDSIGLEFFANEILNDILDAYEF